jgi:hypothetical protein
MNPSDFAARWNQLEEECDVQPRSRWFRLLSGDFPFLWPDELEFLREAGLPDGAPEFRFKQIEIGLPRVDQVYGPKDEELWARIGRDTVAPFRMLGDDQGSNPLVIDTRSHEIWLLDHESDFVPFDFVNTGLLPLAESLLLFLRAHCQEDEVDLDDLLEKLRAIDARAATPGAFWHRYTEDFNDLM